MDILHLKPDEIDEIEISEYPTVIYYCWTTYLRRSDYTISKIFGGTGTKNGSGRTIDWSNINQAHQALQEQKKNKIMIPQNFLNSLNKNE